MNAVYHQRVGIPMGTNCAPELATLVLYVWEARYITELVSNNRLEEAKLHKYTKRYIDDIITFNTNAIPMEAYGGLEYTEQTQADGSVTFLGAKFHNSGERFRISVFDKAKEWPLHVIRYPSVHSNTPHHQSKGIYIGELRRYQLMVNSLSAFKEAATALTQNMYMRGYDGNIMKRAWQSFMEKYGIIFSKTKRKDLGFWYWRMLKWACHTHPRRMPPIQRRVGHQHHQQQIQGQQDHNHLLPQQLIFEAEHDFNEGGNDGQLLEEIFMVGNNDNGNGNGNGDEGNGNGNEGNGNGNEINGEHEEGLFEDIRARINEVRNLADNAKIDTFVITPEINVVPIDIPESPQDNTGRWTEELISVHSEVIVDNRRHLQSAVNNILSRIQRRREKLITIGLYNEAGIQNMLEQDLGNECFKYFCVFCWQRYQTKSSHSGKMCREGRVLRTLATFAHNNNGAQPAPAEGLVLD